MKALKKIAQEFKEVFEGNRCRFAKNCPYYQIERRTCNDIYMRFSEGNQSYCGAYRGLKRNEEKEKIK